MQTILGKHWHHIDNEEVVQLLETDDKSGLDTFEVALRQEHFGKNALTGTNGPSAFSRFVVQFHQPLIYILLVAAFITAIFHEWVDSGVIMGVVLVNAVIGYVQESKAINALDALSRSMTSEATVLRAGERRYVHAQDLVPGDIVLLQSGDKVPADLKLLKTRELQIDESALTGESIPTEKAIQNLEPETQLADRKNMAFSSTLVTYGTGFGVVIAIGDKTEVGQISRLIANAQILATPLSIKMGKFSHTLLFVILGLAAITFTVGVLRGETLLDMFMASVALAVGAIPEGLPAAITITMAIGVSRMARRNAIIRKLPAVETLGSTTIVCSDKTGTLTQNQMTVREVYSGGAVYKVSGVGYMPDGEVRESGSTNGRTPNVAIDECFLAGLLCNDSSLIQSEDGWKIEGDPTEGALIVSAKKAEAAAPGKHPEHRRIDSIPFESQYQYMATLHDPETTGTRVVYMKGSVESIVSRCTHSMDRNGYCDEVCHDSIEQNVLAMASQGLRVIAFARMEVDQSTTSIDHDSVSSGFTFLGLQGMIDPPRPEAISAIRACHRAGICIKMITGDHGKTAEAIAEQIGLLVHASAPLHRGVITGKELNDLSDSELTALIESTNVFARVTPEQKLRLVQSLQELGHVVAMTGDGVNDAPALRRANIGIAMGVTGTEVSKEASDMVLTDDNFASIEAAVEEGRGVFDNLLKFITWTLPTNLGEGLVIFYAVLTGVALPILPVQILWINMTTALLLGLTLAFEPKERGIMLREPRDHRRPLLSRPLVFRVCMVGVLLLTGSFTLFQRALADGLSVAAARTVAVNVFVFGEMFYLLNCRSLSRSMFGVGVFSNRWLIGGILTMITLQLIFTYTPFMNAAFQSEPIGYLEWAMILSTGAIIYGIVGVEKWLRRSSSDLSTKI